MGQNLWMSLSKNSTVWSKTPNGGKTMIYSALHCGHDTLVVELPPCFSSIQRCRQIWWTHFVVPRQRQGRTHCDQGSSSSVAKHTQQRLRHENYKHASLNMNFHHKHSPSLPPTAYWGQLLNPLCSCISYITLGLSTILGVFNNGLLCFTLLIYRYSQDLPGLNSFTVLQKEWKMSYNFFLFNILTITVCINRRTICNISFKRA